MTYWGEAGNERQTGGIAIACFFKKLSRTRFSGTFAFFHAAARQFQGDIAERMAIEPDWDKMILFVRQNLYDLRLLFPD